MKIYSNFFNSGPKCYKIAFWAIDLVLRLISGTELTTSFMEKFYIWNFIFFFKWTS